MQAWIDKYACNLFGPLVLSANLEALMNKLDKKRRAQTDHVWSLEEIVGLI